MILKVKPTSFLKGKIQLPASKSYSIRAFLIAACGGDSTIVGPSDCDDALVAKNVAGQLGSRIKKIGKNNFKIKAHSRNSKVSQFHVKESGTVLRFILPLISLLNRNVKITGEGTLKGRPNLHLTRTLRKNGVRIKGFGPKEGIPINVNGGQLKGGRIEIESSLSSQFVSALLIAAPQLEENTTLILKGKKLVSQTYIEMTLKVLRTSGIRVKRVGLRKFNIKGRQKFKGLKKFNVTSDYGLGAYPVAAATLIPSLVTCKGHFDKRFIQADGAIVCLLKMMGAKYKKIPQGVVVKGPYALKGGSFSLRNCPDLVPIMAVLALFAKGKTRLKNIAHARAKESDRISDLRKELLKIGAKINETKDGLEITPQKNYKSNCMLNPHKDHRLAMAFAVLGLKIGVRIKDIECTSKSYPQFLRDMRLIGARISRV